MDTPEHHMCPYTLCVFPRESRDNSSSVGRVPDQLSWVGLLRLSLAGCWHSPRGCGLCVESTNANKGGEHQNRLEEE